MCLQYDDVEYQDVLQVRIARNEFYRGVCDLSQFVTQEFDDLCRDKLYLNSNVSVIPLFSVSGAAPHVCRRRESARGGAPAPGRAPQERRADTARSEEARPHRRLPAFL